MRLLKLPTIEQETFEVSGGNCSPYQAVGRQTISDVLIVVEDHLLGDTQLEETFRTLKYGPTPDLAEAMFGHNTIPKLEFEKDNIILHGVTPVSMERSATFDGRVFTCKIDHYEITN